MVAPISVNVLSIASIIPMVKVASIVVVISVMLTCVSADIPTAGAKTLNK